MGNAVRLYVPDETRYVRTEAGTVYPVGGVLPADWPALPVGARVFVQLAAGPTLAGTVGANELAGGGGLMLAPDAPDGQPVTLTRGELRAVFCPIGAAR